MLNCTASSEAVFVHTSILSCCFRTLHATPRISMPSSNCSPRMCKTCNRNTGMVDHDQASLAHDELGSKAGTLLIYISMRNEHECHIISVCWHPGTTNAARIQSPMSVLASLQTQTWVQRSGQDTPYTAVMTCKHGMMSLYVKRRRTTSTQYCSSRSLQSGPRLIGTDQIPPLAVSLSSQSGFTPVTKNLRPDFSSSMDGDKMLLNRLQTKTSVTSELHQTRITPGLVLMCWFLTATKVNLTLRRRCCYGFALVQQCLPHHPLAHEAGGVSNR